MIDFHVHITPPDIIANREKYAEKEEYFSLLSRGKANKFATAEDLLAALNTEPQLGHTNNRFAGEVSPLEPQPSPLKMGEGSPLDGTVDRAVVFGFAFRDIGLCRYVNDYVIEKTREYPEKLTGFMVVPLRGTESAKEIERCFHAGLSGVGELFPEGQGFDLEDEAQMGPLCEACAEFSLPVLLHANEPVGHFYPGKTDLPLKKLETFAANNPGLKIILAHFGGGLFFYETMKEIKEKFRNVYYDTAASPFLYDSRIYRVVKALGLCEKILFGSDFPLLAPSRYFPALEESGLTAEEKLLILSENARKLLGNCGKDKVFKIYQKMI